MSDQIIIPVSQGHGGLLQGVTFSETREQNYKEPCFRLYCTMHHTAYAVQIRGRVPLNAKGGRKHDRNLIATANLSWADLEQIAEYVAAIRKEKADLVTDQEDYQIAPAEKIRQAIKNNDMCHGDLSDLMAIAALVENGDLKGARQIIDKASENVHFFTIKPDEQ